jgi:hypothetical protein
MKHSLRVRRCKTRAQLPPDVDNLLRRQAADAAQQRREIFAADQFHGEKDHALGFADVEDATDGRVGNLAREAHLAEDPLARGWACGLDDL